MIKFSEFFEAFMVMVDEVEIHWMELEGDDERDIKIKEIIKQAHHYDHIFKRWEQASKMRQWINEKKKNLAEKVKKEVESEFKKKKIEGSEKPPMKEQVKIDAESQPVEMIDTSSKPTEESSVKVAEDA